MERPSSATRRVPWRAGLSAILLLTATLTSAQAGLPAPWRFVTPQPQGNDLLCAWAPGPNQLYAGGHGGVILRWDGTRWTTESTPTQKTIFAIHGRTTSDIWAVGGDPYTSTITNRSLILHFDGTAWKEVAAPQFNGYTYTFNAVHALAANDVWATIDNGTFLVHYDGKKWDWMSLPLSVEGSFKAIASAGADHLFVAGTHGQLLHRDHGTWKLEQKRETGNMSFNIISQLWAHDPDTVYAAGNWSQFYRRNADGTWTEIPVNSGEPFGVGFCGLWGRSPTEIYLLSESSIFAYPGSGSVTRTDFRMKIRRQWLAGTGAGDRLYGVGPAGVAHEYVPDGQGGGTLSALTVGGQAELDFIPAGGASVGGVDLLVCGFAHEGAGRWPLWHLANGVARQFPALPPGATRPTSVKAVAATSLTDVVVAWENFADWHRGVHRWDGTQWSEMPGADGTTCFWRSPTGRLHAAGPARVQYWNSGDNTWQTLYTVPGEPPGMTLRALWGRADNDLFVGTADGRVLRYNGTTWKSETTPGTGVIVALAGTATEVYAVGEDGLAWRRSGTSWQRLTGVPTATGENFTALVAASDGVYAAQRTPSGFTGGGLGRLWRFSGTAATQVLQGLSQPLDVLVANEAGKLVGFASRDFIITDASTPAAPVTQRIDLSVSDWQAVGGTGIAVRSDAPSGSRPMVTVQRVAAPAPFSPVPASYGEHWLLLEDRFYGGSAIPPLQVRVEYDPADLAPGLAGAPLALYRHTDTAVSEIPCLHDPLAHTLTTTAPVDFSIWTVGPSTATPVPALQVTRVDGLTISLSWPADATGYRLEAVADLTLPVAWAAWPWTPTVTGGRAVVTVEVGGGAQFFRLHKPGN